MFPAKLSRAALALASLSLPASLTAQDLPGAGFALAPLPYPGLVQTATLANGDVIVWDGAALARHAADGTLLVTYASFLVPVYPSFIALDASESYALFGESTNHSIARLDLGNGAMTGVATLVFNYDAVQRSGTSWIVSAATCGGFACGNKLYSVDANGGSTVEEADLSGPSGPVEVDAAGNVYYANQFTTSSGPASVVRLFLAAQIDGPTVLGDADGFVIGSGYAGSSDLLHDAETNRLYMAENDYLSGANRVRIVTPSEVNAPIVVEGATFGWITGLELIPGSDAAVFAAFQPVSGGRLLYNTTDFWSSWARNEVRPARPQLALSGPGASGPGLLTIGLSGAPAQGLALLAATPTSALMTGELPLPLLSSLPVLSPFDLAQAIVLPVSLAIDAQGGAQLSVLHQGDLLGQIAVQALAISPDLSLLATSTVALL